MKMAKLMLCFCGGQPEIKAVGDNKQYFACICSNCGKTPVRLDEARATRFGAIKIWNRSVNNDP